MGKRNPQIWFLIDNKYEEEIKKTNHFEKMFANLENSSWNQGNTGVWKLEWLSMLEFNPFRDM